MSAGYASRLSEYRNKGVCGLPEGYDSERCLKIKLKRLAEWVADSKHLVILTGAGISTSAGIPDFRGPKGVWTLENQKNQKNVRKASKDGRRKLRMNLVRSENVPNHHRHHHHSTHLVQIFPKLSQR